LTEARETAPADQFYEQTVTQTKNVGAPIGAFLLKAWADRLIKRNAWDKARNLYERALAMIGEDNTHDLFSASIWNGLGIIAYIRGDYPVQKNIICARSRLEKKRHRQFGRSCKLAESWRCGDR